MEFWEGKCYGLGGLLILKLLTKRKGTAAWMLHIYPPVAWRYFWALSEVKRVWLRVYFETFDSLKLINDDERLVKVFC